MQISKAKNTNTEPFLQGNALGYILVAIFFTPFGAMLAGYSWGIFYLYLAMNVLTILFYKFIHSRNQSLMMYNYITSFVLLIQLSLYFSVPFFVYLYATPIFFINMIIYICIFLYSYRKRYKLLEMAGNPFSNITFRLIILFSIILLIIGGLMSIQGNGLIMDVITENQRGFVAFGILNIIGLLLLNFSTVFLIKLFKARNK